MHQNKIYQLILHFSSSDFERHFSFGGLGRRWGSSEGSVTISLSQNIFLPIFYTWTIKPNIRNACLKFWKTCFLRRVGQCARAVSPSHFLSHERSSGADQPMYRLAREGEMLTKQVWLFYEEFASNNYLSVIFLVLCTFKALSVLDMIHSKTRKERRKYFGFFGEGEGMAKTNWDIFSYISSSTLHQSQSVTRWLGKSSELALLRVLRVVESHELSEVQIPVQSSQELTLKLALVKNPICSIFYLAPLPSTDVSTGLWWSNTPAFNISNRPPRCAASPCLNSYWYSHYGSIWLNLDIRSIWSPMVIVIMVSIIVMVFLHKKKISLQSPTFRLRVEAKGVQLWPEHWGEEV